MPDSGRDWLRGPAPAPRHWPLCGPTSPGLGAGAALARGEPSARPGLAAEPSEDRGREPRAESRDPAGGAARCGSGARELW